MIVEKADTIDYEPLAFELTPTSGTALSRAEVEAFLEGWLNRRDDQPVCDFGCPYKYLGVSEGIRGRVEVAIEWLCDPCMEVLFPALEARFGNIERIYVGYEPQAFVQPPPPPATIAFPARTVTYEDGRREEVASFTIANSDVTVAEMEKFCAATGYVTSAERRSQGDDTFRDNAYLRVQEEGQRDIYPAWFLSYDDAAAYCAWAGYRLPTEGEFFVAALIDDEEHDARPEAQVVRQLCANGGIMSLSGSVITDTRVDDLIVVRNGPRVVKDRFWNRGNPPRRLVSKAEPVGIIMRVCL
ncbi:MAG TPA: SUMF1/EgtB/PvdO family nonheme iron enzyme [Planctomycetaceae bacterium]|jgi:putative hemolysin|nr:SUMF1/EgtB/PvdO family nonheme iron enzyme [Planctomycetaceae bacterium]